MKKLCQHFQQVKRAFTITWFKYYRQMDKPQNGSRHSQLWMVSRHSVIKLITANAIFSLTQKSHWLSSYTSITLQCLLQSVLMDSFQWKSHQLELPPPWQVLDPLFWWLYFPSCSPHPALTPHPTGPNPHSSCTPSLDPMPHCSNPTHQEPAAPQGGIKDQS